LAPNSALATAYKYYRWDNCASENLAGETLFQLLKQTWGYSHCIAAYCACCGHLLSYDISSWIVGKVNVNAGNLTFDLASNKDNEGD